MCGRHCRFIYELERGRKPEMHHEIEQYGRPDGASSCRWVEDRGEEKDDKDTTYSCLRLLQIQFPTKKGDNAGVVKSRLQVV